MRGLVRLVLLVIVIAAIGAYFLGYRVRRANDTFVVERGTSAPGQVGTTGVIDTAREGAARLGEKAAVAANEATKAFDDGALTTKIKAKMALDDHVRAREIDVDTSNGIVTLTGRVHSNDERDRALRLASETSGVRGVKNRLEVK